MEWEKEESREKVEETSYDVQLDAPPGDLRGKYTRAQRVLLGEIWAMQILLIDVKMLLDACASTLSGTLWQLTC